MVTHAKLQVAHEKADLTRYRDAGSDVFGICAELGASCERTSIDEAYLDVTDMANKLLDEHISEKTAIKVQFFQ